MSRGVDATASVTPMGPSQLSLVKLIHNFDQEHFPDHPVVISPGRMEVGGYRPWGMCSTHGPAQLMPVAAPASGSLQSHQQPLKAIHSAKQRKQTSALASKPRLSPQTLAALAQRAWSLLHLLAPEC